MTETYELSATVGAALAGPRVRLRGAPTLNDEWVGGVVIAPRGLGRAGRLRRAVDCDDVGELAIELRAPTTTTTTVRAAARSPPTTTPPAARRRGARDRRRRAAARAADATCGVDRGDWDGASKTFNVSCQVPEIASRRACGGRST